MDKVLYNLIHCYSKLYRIILRHLINNAFEETAASLNVTPCCSVHIYALRGFSRHFYCYVHVAY